MMQTTYRTCAWALLLAIFVFTDGPIGLRPITHFSPDIERFAALMALGATFILAYPRQTAFVLILTCCGICLFELLQLVADGRHAHMSDVGFKCAGAIAGVAFGHALHRLRAWAVATLQDRFNPRALIAGRYPLAVPIEESN